MSNASVSPFQRRSPNYDQIPATDIMKYSIFVALSLALAAAARPNFRPVRRQGFVLQNGEAAIAEKCAFLPPTPRSRVLIPNRPHVATDSGG